MAAPRKKVVKGNVVEYTLRDVPRIVQQYADNKAMSERAQTEAARWNKELKALLDKHGVPDENGNLWIDVDGVPGIRAIKHTKRESAPQINAEKLEEYLREHDLWEACTTTVVVIDEDKLWDLVYRKKIPQKVIKTLSEKTVSWALNLVKE